MFVNSGFRVVLAAFCLVAASFAASPGYHVAATYKVGGDGGWDYLTTDASARRVYISRGTHVMVLDADSGKSVGDIPNTPGVHGIALAPELGRGFTSNGREGTVTIFDIKTLAPIGEKWGGTESRCDFVRSRYQARLHFQRAQPGFNSHRRNERRPCSARSSSEGSLSSQSAMAKAEIFVNIEDKSELDAIDPAKLEVKSKWPLAPCKEPSGLAIDRKNRRLFVGCDNKMMAVVRCRQRKGFSDARNRRRRRRNRVR